MEATEPLYHIRLLLRYDHKSNVHWRSLPKDAHILAAIVSDVRWHRERPSRNDRHTARRPRNRNRASNATRREPAANEVSSARHGCHDGVTRNRFVARSTSAGVCCSRAMSENFAKSRSLRPRGKLCDKNTIQGVATKRVAECGAALSRTLDIRTW